jgi:alpha-glucosidase (family GH31 glycosyl hydrolase)
MVGGVLLPADVSTSHSAGGNENVTSVNIPPGASWYLWNTTNTQQGNQTIVQNVTLKDIVVYVRQGAILPMQAAAVQ